MGPELASGVRIKRASRAANESGGVSAMASAAVRRIIAFASASFATCPSSSATDASCALAGVPACARGAAAENAKLHESQTAYFIITP